MESNLNKHTKISDENLYYTKSRAKNERSDDSAMETAANFITQKFNAGELKNVLELGCGTGELIPLLPAGIECTGIDPSKFIIDKLSAQYPGHKFFTSYAEELPVRSDSIDIVLSFQTLEHVYDPKKALGEMVRVIRPGGYIIVSAPNLECPWSMPNAVRHYSKLRKFIFMLERFSDLFLRNFGILKFRMVDPNYAKFTGKFEKSDDDLTYITSAFEVVQWLKRGGCRLLSSRGFQPKKMNLKNRIKKAITVIPVLRYYDSGMFLIFQKKSD